MKRASIAALLLLTGCAPATTPTATPAEADNCLTVSSSALASLQRHLDAKMTSQQIIHSAAVESGEGWYLAARVDSQGDNVTAVWFTTSNPTVDEENAYVSVDAMAETISDYLRPTGFNVALPGAKQALACL